MRLCPHCDSELPERAKFCPACGTALPVSGAEDQPTPLTVPVKASLPASPDEYSKSDSASKEQQPVTSAVQVRPLTQDLRTTPVAPQRSTPPAAPPTESLAPGAVPGERQYAALKSDGTDRSRPKFNLHLDVWQGTRSQGRANAAEQRRRQKVERHQKTRLNVGDPPPSGGPRTPGRRRGAMITAVVVLLIFALIVTGIVVSIISRSQETQPYVLYQTDGYLKVVHVLSGQSVRLSAIGDGVQHKGAVPSWYYQTAKNGTVLYFAVGDRTDDYALKRVSYSDLFSGNDGVTTLTEHAQKPFVVNSAGQAFFCTTSGQLMQSDGRRNQMLAESVIDYMLNTSGSAIGYITADRTVSTVRVKDRSATCMTCPDSADALLWVSEDGRTVYVERNAHLYAQSKDYSRLLAETYNRVEPVSAAGAFYYTVDAEVTMPILELLTDRYQTEDAKLKPPAHPLTSPPTAPLLPVEEREPLNSGTARGESAWPRATAAASSPTSASSEPPASAAASVPPGTAASEKTSAAARQNPAVLVDLPWGAVRPVIGAGGENALNLTANSKNTAVKQSDSAQPSVSGTSALSTSGTVAGFGTASQSAAEPAATTSASIQSSQTSPASTLSPEAERAVYETYRNEMDQYLKKLERDAKRAALADQTVTFMRSQLWYFDGSQAKMIDTGLDEVEAINDTADTIIYRVSGRLGEKNADLSEIEDVDRFLNQVAEDSERGYRLVNRGVCSTLAPAGYISEVQFAEKGTHLIFVHGDDAALTNTYLESQVVFDTVILDREVDQYVYDESTGRILYFKSGASGRFDLYEDSRKLYSDAGQALPAGKETLVLGGVDPESGQGTLARLLPNREEPLKLDDHVQDVVRTSGLSGAYIRQDNGVYALLYNRKSDRRQVLERSNQPIHFIRPLQVREGQRIQFELPSSVLSDDVLIDPTDGSQ